MIDLVVVVLYLRNLLCGLQGKWKPVIVAVAMLPVAFGTQAQTVASEAELDLWKSAQRIDTAEAYRAFVSAYPTGTFAAMAQAAINKPVSVARMGASTASASDQAGDGLRTFSRAAGIDSVAFGIGDRWIGPGFIWVGRTGTFKQVTIPPGEWVVLSAMEHASTQSTQTSSGIVSTRQIDVARIALGRFTGKRLTTLLYATVSTGTSLPSDWSDVAACDAGEAMRIRYERGTFSQRDECASIRLSGSPLAELSGSDALVNQSLRELGADVFGSSVIATLSYADRAHGYLGIMRIDWPRLGDIPDLKDAADWNPGKMTNNTAFASYSKKASAWLDGWRVTQRNGFLSGFEGDDLVAIAAKKIDY